MNLKFLTNKIIRQRWVQRYSSTTVVISKINSPLGEGACADAIKINLQKLGFFWETLTAFIIDCFPNVLWPSLWGEQEILFMSFNQTSLTLDSPVTMLMWFKCCCCKLQWCTHSLNWVICLTKVQEMWWLVQVTFLWIFDWDVFTITLVITPRFTQVRIVSRGKRNWLRQKALIVQFQTTFYIFTYI